MQLDLTDAGFLALGNGSFRWEQAAAITAILLNGSYQPSPLHDEYEDVDQNEIVDAGYVQQAVASRTTTLVNGEGSPTLKNVMYDSADVSWGSNVTLSARFIALVVGTAGALGHAAMLLGIVDFGEVKSSTNSTFSFAPAATGWMRLIPA